MHKENSGTITTRPVVLVLLFLFATSLFLLTAPVSAHALSTDYVTGKSNEDGGSKILGDKPARVSWEGTVGADETVMEITLDFPANCGLTSDVSVEVIENIMDDPVNPYENKGIQYSQQLTPESLHIIFEEGLQPNNKVIIRIYGFIFPNVDADHQITGSYVDDNGASHVLEEGPDPISVVSETIMQEFVTWLDAQPWVQAWNSNKFLHSFLDPVRGIASLPNLFGGWLLSLGLVALGFPLAIPLGLGISFLRMSRFGVLKFISSIYVNVIRGTPLFLQIFIAFMGIPLFIPNLNSFLVASVVLAINSSAYLAEIFRAGIQSIHKGQFEASASLGMSGFQTMFSVIIPQTIRRVIPTMTSEFILLFKDTSLLAAVGVMEMMMFAKIQANVSGNMTPYVVAAAFYLIVTLPLTRVISVFERKLALSEGRAEPEPEKKPKVKRVGLFKTTAPDVATDSGSDDLTVPIIHGSK